jgi:hypothetical protein
MNASRLVNEKDSTDNAAMSTLMRTLRNLRQIGFKVCVSRSFRAICSAN